VEVLNGVRWRVFEKAQQKVREAGVFVGDLHRDNLSSDQLAAYWSALLDAGYMVTEALEAEVDLLLKKQPTKPTYHSVFAGWHQTLTPADAEVFEVLQKVRGVEVHTTNTSTTFVTRVDEQRKPRDVPNDSTLRAIYASYMAMGMLAHQVTVGVLTYEFIGNATHRDPKVQALLTRFNQGGARTVLGAATDYAKLLTGLVAHVVAVYK